MRDAQLELRHQAVDCARCTRRFKFVVTDAHLSNWQAEANDSGYLYGSRTFDWESHRAHLIHLIWTSLTELRPFELDRWTTVLELIGKGCFWLQSPATDAQLRLVSPYFCCRHCGHNMLASPVVRKEIFVNRPLREQSLAAAYK